MRLARWLIPLLCIAAALVSCATDTTSTPTTIVIALKLLVNDRLWDIFPKHGQHTDHRIVWPQRNMVKKLNLNTFEEICPNKVRVSFAPFLDANKPISLLKV